MTKLTGIIMSENKLTGSLGVRNEINVDIIGTGARGKEGKSAYEIWLDLGNTGTEQDFIDSLGGGDGSGDMLKATYDPQSKEADAFSMDNMVEGTTNKIFTATERTKLDGVEASANNYTHPESHAGTMITIADAGGYFTGTTTEAALQEIGATLDGLDAALEALL